MRFWGIRFYKKLKKSISVLKFYARISAVMNKKTTDILLFDSGVGGLSIFAEITKLMPAFSICFASDNQGFPYGTKTDDDLLAQIDRSINILIAMTNPKVIVIACNSASTIALDHLRQKITIPIIGVVPAIKTAAQMTKAKHIGLLATPGTIQRPYTQQLFDTFARDCDTTRVGSSEMVKMAEEKLRGYAIDMQKLAKELEPFQNTTVDTIVLGCTHFPHLREEIQMLLPPHVALIDSGLAIAKQTQRILGDHQPSHSPYHLALFTQYDKNAERLEPCLKQYKIHKIDYL